MHLRNQFISQWILIINYIKTDLKFKTRIIDDDTVSYTQHIYLMNYWILYYFDYWLVMRFENHFTQNSLLLCEKVYSKLNRQHVYV